MTDARGRFDAACERVRSGTFPVTNDQKLMLYALFKIAGGARAPGGARPLHPVARAKWDAWTEFGQSYSATQALQLYVQLVDTLSASLPEK
mgnify:CR=1 FL=1